MPEQAHLLSDETLKRIGYRLLCSIYAEYEWPTLRRDDDPDVLDDFLSNSDTEISELLVSLAALARASDDALETLDAVAKVFPHGVGKLQINNSEEEPMSPREACNKIMHARSMEWEFARNERNPLYENFYQAAGADIKGDFKCPRAILHGSHRGSSWVAFLDVVPFIIATANWDAWKWKFT